ncbi:hypothetical protein RhiirA1_543916, partial [Rhizophagus irregularis]
MKFNKIHNCFNLQSGSEFVLVLRRINKIFKQNFQHLLNELLTYSGSIVLLLFLLLSLSFFSMLERRVSRFFCPVIRTLSLEIICELVLNSFSIVFLLTLTIKYNLTIYYIISFIKN